MISKNGKPVHSILLGSFLVLAGAAAWILLSAGHAGALVNVDQESTNTNVGVAVANTGGNVGVGNASTNNANSKQNANASGGGKGDKIAVNSADVSNHSDGSATIVTGDANATGNTASNHTTQAVDAGHGSKGLVNVDQNSNNVNVGIAVANTGGNIGVGNASTNKANSNQNANASGSGSGDKLASNLADVSNHSNGSATIITGNASATGNMASNHTVQTVDASGAGWLVLGDQDSNNLNFGLGVANSGLNIGVGNASTNAANSNHNANASGSGSGDKIAVNDVVGSNWSDADVLIHTGNAHAVGNVANNSNTQVLDGHHVVAVGGSSALPMTLLFLLMGVLFIGRPARHVAVRRRT